MREPFSAWDGRANIVRQRREVQQNRRSIRPRPRRCSSSALSQRSANLLDPTIDRFSIALPKTTTTEKVRARVRAIERDASMFFSR